MKKLTPEQEILKECLDKNQCEKLVGQYSNLIRAIVKKEFQKRGIPFTFEDIEDRVQDVFEALFKNDKHKLRQYNPKFGLSLKNWIILISTRVIQDYFKRKKELLNITDEKIRIPVDDLDITCGNHFENGFDAETKCISDNAIEKLLPEQKLLIKLEYYKGLSPQKIGKILGKTTNNIYQIKKRALENLRKILQG